MSDLVQNPNKPACSDYTWLILKSWQYYSFLLLNTQKTISWLSCKMSRISSVLTLEFHQSAMFHDFYSLLTLYAVSTYIQKNENNSKMSLDLTACAVEVFHRDYGLWGAEIINRRCIMSSSSSCSPHSLSSVCSGTVFSCWTSTFWQCLKLIWTNTMT